MKALAWRLRDELGLGGLAALCLLAAAGIFYLAALQPLQERSAVLQAELAAQARKGGGQPSSAAEKLGTFYRFFDKQEQTTDWLAKLYAIGQATGVQLQSASYKVLESGTASSAQARGLSRYEIVLPVQGSYTQLREFLRRALAEIPVLSLDQLSLKREARGDGAVSAELRLTIHGVKP